MNGTRVTGISDDWYGCTKEVIVMSLGTRQSAGQKSGCTWNCRQSKAEITNKF